MASSSPYRVAPSSPRAQMVSASGKTLPLAHSSVRVDASAGFARVTLEQRFQNPHREALTVTYSLPLPQEGAVSGFAFVVGDRRIVGEVDRKASARERFERAVLDGKSAALLEQDRASLFTQEIGNIPPGEEVLVEIAVDQRLLWLDEGLWEWRFPTVVGAAYLGQPGRTPDAAKIATPIADGPLGVKFDLSCRIRDALPEGRVADSPSHLVRATREGDGVSLELRERQGAPLDRDIVVRWPVASQKVGVSVDLGRVSGRAPAEHTHGLLTLVPPTRAFRGSKVSRDLIVLLDTSGSMSGDPLAQAVRVTSALIDTLDDGDQLELIEFSSAARRWKSRPVAATRAARREALAWLKSLRASGSTEMREGILAAMETLRVESQRQIVLITDGMIGFEAEVVAAIAERLPSGSRVHTVGVGSAVNRSLTAASARAGHGVEVVIGLGEDPERAAARIVARTDAPLVVDLSLGGSALFTSAPAKLPDLFAGAPALVSLALHPDGGDLFVRGRTAEGDFEEHVVIPPMSTGAGNPALAALFARERVEDLEMRIAGGEPARGIDAQIERLGLDFQIATRLTSWVAVSREATVDPRAPSRRERMPHELAHGISAEAAGLRPSFARAATRSASQEHMVGSMLIGSMPPAGLGGPVPSAPASLMDEDEDADLVASVQQPAWWPAATRAAAAPPMPASPAAPRPPRSPLPPGGFAPPAPPAFGGPPPPPPSAPAAASGAPPAPRARARQTIRVDVAESPEPEPARKRGIVDKITGFFRRGPAAGGFLPTLEAKLVGRDGRRLTFEITAVDTAVNWALLSAAWIHFVPTGVQEATVDLTRSTPAVLLSAGVAARVVVELAADDARDLAALEIELGGVRLRLPLA